MLHRLNDIPADVAFAPLEEWTPDWVRELMKYDLDQLDLNDFCELYKYYQERYQQLSRVIDWMRREPRLAHEIANVTALHDLFYMRFTQFVDLYARLDNQIEAWDDAHPDSQEVPAPAID